MTTPNAEGTGVPLPLHNVDEAWILTLAIAIVTPLLAGHEAEKFFEWAEAVDRRMAQEVPDPPVLMKIVMPLLRRLVLPSWAALGWAEPYTPEQHAQLAAHTKKLHAHLRDLWVKVNAAGQQLDGLAKVQDALQGHEPPRPADRPT